MGPLDFYNLIFAGSNRRIKLRFDSSPIKLHEGSAARKFAKSWADQKKKRPVLRQGASRCLYFSAYQVLVPWHPGEQEFADVL